jgi:hypothetical protein
MGYVHYRGETGRRVIGADPAFVVAKGYVHDPMQSLLDRPMAADDGSQKDRHQDEQGDVVACLALDLIAGLTGASHHAAAFGPSQLWRCYSRAPSWMTSVIRVSMRP